MIERFHQLSIREKQTVIIGAACIFLFLFYSLLWAPFTATVENTRQNAQQNAMLLSWMQKTDKEIQLLSKKNLPKKTHFQGSFLSALQNNIQHSEISSYLTDMQQKEHNVIELNFKEVEFDKLISWLISDTAEEWIISALTVTKGSKPGMVSAIIALKLS